MKTRNDFMRRAVGVMAQDETGAMLARIFQDTCPGLNEDSIARESNNLKRDVLDTVRTIRHELTRLVEELKAIDA